ncbi:hypothetical protein MRX96_036773 [Rhipicephalus microplus]
MQNRRSRTYEHRRPHVHHHSEHVAGRTANNRFIGRWKRTAQRRKASGTHPWSGVSKLAVVNGEPRRGDGTMRRCSSPGQKPRRGCCCCGQRALRSPRGGIARTLPPPAGPCPLAAGLDAGVGSRLRRHSTHFDVVPRQLSSPATTACRASGSLTPANRLPFSGSALFFPRPRAKRRGGWKNVPADAFLRRCFGGSVEERRRQIRSGTKMLARRSRTPQLE